MRNLNDEFGLRQNGPTVIYQYNLVFIGRNVRYIYPDESKIFFSNYLSYYLGPISISISFETNHILY